MKFVPISMPRHPNRRSEFRITLIYSVFQKHGNKSIEVRKGIVFKNRRLRSASPTVNKVFSLREIFKISMKNKNKTLTMKELY